MENEANFIELLDNFDEIFGKNIETDGRVAEFYSEICLNIPVIYFILGRMKDVEDSWDRISAICEKREAYKTTFAKFKLMKVSIDNKFNNNVETS